MRRRRVFISVGLAGEEARANGFDEAILLTEEGPVSEGSACNIFLVRKGLLVTPAVSEDVFGGITRATIMELVAEMGVHTEERRVDRSELYAAHEIFFTRTAFEITPVVEVDRRQVGTGAWGC